MERKDLICIGCPMGCPIRVELSEGKIISVTGNTCPHGAEYARKEVLHPTRIVTSFVRVQDSADGAATVSCKTASDVPKEKIFDVIRDIKDVVITCPVKIGDVIKADVAGTGVDMIATKEVK